jgi:hypothetical protein
MEDLFYSYAKFLLALDPLVLIHSAFEGFVKDVVCLGGSHQAVDDKQLKNEGGKLKLGGMLLILASSGFCGRLCLVLIRELDALSGCTRPLGQPQVDTQG